MGFQQALSGLNGAATALDSISNNIANSGTVGFKGSATQFSDLFASSLSGAGNTQVGMGSAVASVTQQFTQGSLSTTNNPLDVAINGNGMFPMTSDGMNYTYSRNGQFQLDQSGSIINSDGMKLCGYGASNGTIIPSDPPVPLTVGATMDFKTTTKSSMELNVSSAASQPTAMTRGSIWPASTVTPPAFGSGGAAGPNMTIDATNNTMTLALDGQPVASATGYSISLTQKTYLNVYDLASGVQTDINNALVQQGSTSKVDVTYNSAGYLQIQSRASGSLSQIASVGGTAVADLFGSGAAVSAAGTAGTDNFNPTDPTTYTSTTSETVYDSSGNSHSLSVYFAKTAEPNVWQTYFALDGQAANINGNTASAGTFRPATLTYTGTGVWTDLTPPSGGTAPNGLGLINISNGGASSTPTVSITLDLHKTTQTSLGFGVKGLTQDGYSSGTLAGLSVGNDGLIKATYTNGQSSPAGQLALVNFRNPSALQSIGNNQWRETVEAGKQPTSTPGKDGLGTVQAGSVEQSNVDLTAELVSMITQQRAYQANAQSIKTQDQITQTIVNLR